MHIQLRQSGFLYLKILKFKGSVQLFFGKKRKPKQVIDLLTNIHLYFCVDSCRIQK